MAPETILDSRSISHFATFPPTSAMAPRLCFQDLPDDLALLVLDKLSGPGLGGAYESARELARFACVSFHCAELVREQAWERACRKALPDLCRKLVPVGGVQNSPGGVGWGNFARLLTSCPGRACALKGPWEQPSKQHFFSQTSLPRLASPDELLTGGAETCEASLFLCCAEDHKARSNEGWPWIQDVVRQKVYRGYIGSVREWAAGIGLRFLNEDEVRLEEERRYEEAIRDWNEGRETYEDAWMESCFFCQAPVQIIPPQFIKEILSPGIFCKVSTVYRVCCNGHFHGVLVAEDPPSTQLPFPW